MVQRKLFVLLVSDGDESFESLRALLKSQGIEVWSSRTLAEAARLVDETHPELVFTATQHADGTWRDVIIMAEKATEATNVIVVGKYNDIGLYLATMDYGAFDFILPPFEPEPIRHVVRVAAEAVRRRREVEALKALA
jgi:DNA-binding NtrC family response regulator